MFDLTLYSEGAFRFNEIWDLPFYYFEEVIEAKIDYNKKIDESRKSSRTKTF
jgi:hypothetical protein